MPFVLSTFLGIRRGRSFVTIVKQLEKFALRLISVMVNFAQLSGDWTPVTGGLLESIVLSSAIRWKHFMKLATSLDLRP